MPSTEAELIEEREDINELLELATPTERVGVYAHLYSRRDTIDVTLKRLKEKEEE